MLRATLLLLAGFMGVAGTAPVQAGGKDEPANVKTVTGIAYYEGKDADPEKHKLDLYLPKDMKNFPVVFFIHGGGWTKGDRSKFATMGKVLASNGVGMVSTSYRLSPQVKHPGHMEDVARAFAWTQKNISKYGGDPKNLYVSGHSAGGHLAALLGTDESYLKANGLGLADVRGVIPISGVFVIAPGKIAAAFGDDAEACKQASPLTHVVGKHPPFLILYAEMDGKGFDTMAADFAAALKKASCEATVQMMADRNHGTIVSSITTAEDPTARLILEFVAKHSSK